MEPKKQVADWRIIREKLGTRKRRTCVACSKVENFSNFLVIYQLQCFPSIEETLVHEYYIY